MAEKLFPCKDCGAEVEFKAGALALECPYCGHQNAIPQSEEDINELDFHEVLANLENEADVVTVQTISCGECAASYTRKEGVTSDECPFCGTPVVSEGGSVRLLKPESLLPFHITREQARTAFTDWIKSLWFAPNRLKKYGRMESKLNGLYVPYWTYDSYVTSYYTGQRGEDYWTTETYTTMENGKSVTKTRQVRKTRWYPASGVVWNNFDDVLVLASHSLPRKHTEALEPWDLENLAGYQDDYLAGYQAESYQVELKEGFEQAKEIMDGTIRTTICNDIGGDHQRIHSVNSQYDNITFKHILLPIWMSVYRYTEKIYRFLVNARTGEVQGERPWSWVKITLAVLGGLAVIGGIIWAVNAGG